MKGLISSSLRVQGSYHKIKQYRAKNLRLPQLDALLEEATATHEIEFRE